jgi:outer membrane receptor protein involved in Fe transport
MQLKRNYLFGTTVLAGLMAVAVVPAHAQDPAGGATQVEEVVVTGSRIRRDPTNAPTPLIQITREEMDQSGEANVVDYLADIPALTFSTVPEDTTGSNLNDGGLSLLNLRALGSNRTLVLVNGRRHVGSAPGSLSVDVDTIPRLLIENVEVITGGAASVYGADAVSGVVNFILKDDYEGLEVDGAYSQINQDGQASSRIGFLWGENLFDDTLNVYLTGEYKENDQVTDADMDWLREGWALIGWDTDPATAPTDGVPDAILINNARTFIRGTNFGGITILATGVQPSPASDPDVAPVSCSLASYGSGCFYIAPSNNPNNAFVYDSNGASQPLVFGAIRQGTGNRITSNGGNGQELNTQQGGTSRLPQSEEWRVQSGFTWDLSDSVTAFGEAKYAEEETYDAGQRTFYDFNIAAYNPANPPVVTTSGQLQIGLDNAYLPSNVRLAIQNNMRQIFNSAGVVTSTIADPRAQHKLYPTVRSQLNQRDLQRYVLGLRGDAGDVGFVKNLAWEIGWTYGEMNNENFERADGYNELQMAADAVVDTAGIVNGRPGEIVCRTQLRRAQGYPIPTSGSALLGYNGIDNDMINRCTPVRIFGEGGFSDAAREFIGAEIFVTDKNTQEDFLGFVSGELWDFWGAGPIGFAAGLERRMESTEGTGRDGPSGGRMLFLNEGPNFPRVSYDTNEAFVELRIPLFQDSWLGRSAEISGAYRTADYSTVGVQDTYSIQGSWRPIDDLLFRVTQNTAIRVPNLGELYEPAGQTFANGFADPCVVSTINALTDAAIQANRRANCQALSNADGHSFTFVSPTDPNAYQPTYGTGGIPGLDGGNPFLQPETSDSFTASVVWTPSYFPNFSMVLDYYKIEIDDAIATTSAQQNANQCVNQPTINAAACATITRDPTTWMVVGFIQGSLNYAKLTAEGVDFSARYRFDIVDVIGQDWGRINWNLRGSWTIEQNDYTNIADPTFPSIFADTVGMPRVRFLSTVAWQPNDRLTLSWDWDWQGSQEIGDVDALVANPDIREFAKYLETGAFNQHDFTMAYQVTDDLRVRAGVVNAFDEESAHWLGRHSNDNFDMFGRRYFVNFNYKVW